MVIGEGGGGGEVGKGHLVRTYDAYVRRKDTPRSAWSILGLGRFKIWKSGSLPCKRSFFSKNREERERNGE